MFKICRIMPSSFKYKNHIFLKNGFANLQKTQTVMSSCTIAILVHFLNFCQTLTAFAILSQLLSYLSYFCHTFQHLHNFVTLAQLLPYSPVLTALLHFFTSTIFSFSTIQHFNFKNNEVYKSINLKSWVLQAGMP